MLYNLLRISFWNVKRRGDINPNTDLGNITQQFLNRDKLINFFERELSSIIYV